MVDHVRRSSPSGGHIPGTSFAAAPGSDQHESLKVMGPSFRVGIAMTHRRVMSLVLLAAWVLYGPMAIAFGGCAATVASCHLACTPLACPASVRVMAPEALAALIP